MDNERDELDRLIDGALAGYSDAEALAGLEERVLNRVRAARARRRRWFAWAAVAAVAASVVVVGIVVRVERRLSVPKPAEVVKVAPAPASSAVMRPVERVRHVARRRQPGVLPKLEQFPTPTPLTAEERALLALARQDPEELGKFAEMERQSDAPIEVQPIRIAPLREDGDQ